MGAPLARLRVPGSLIGQRFAWKRLPLARLRLLVWFMRVSFARLRALLSFRCEGILVHARVLRALACAPLVQARGHPRSTARASRAGTCPSRSGARASSLNRPRLTRWRAALSFRHGRIILHARAPLIRPRERHRSCARASRAGVRPSRSGTSASSRMRAPLAWCAYSSSFLRERISRKRPLLARLPMPLSLRHGRIIPWTYALARLRVPFSFRHARITPQACAPCVLAHAPFMHDRAPRAPARALLVQARAHHPLGVRLFARLPMPLSFMTEPLARLRVPLSFRHVRLTDGGPCRHFGPVALDDQGPRNRRASQIVS